MSVACSMATVPVDEEITSLTRPPSAINWFCTATRTARDGEMRRRERGARRRGREPEGDPSVQGSVVVRHQSLPGVQVRCLVLWRFSETRAREVQSVWPPPRGFLPTARFRRPLGLRTVLSEGGRQGSGLGRRPAKRENDPNVELVERARTSVAKGWERRAGSELRWRQSRVDPVEPRGGLCGGACQCKRRNKESYVLRSALVAAM